MMKLHHFTLSLAALVASPALAERPPAIERAVVRTADLDLASVAGQRLLDRRLAHAVIEVCGAASDADLAGSNDVRRCRDETRARIAAERERVVELASRSATIVIAAR